MNGRGGLAIAVLAALVVGFSLGLVAGITFMRFGPPAHGPFAMAHGEGPMHAPGLPPGAAMGPGMGMGPGGRMNPGPMLRHLCRALDLTPAQRERVHAILMRTHASQAAMRDSTHAAIERVLTPEQRARWRTMESEYHRTWRERSGRPPIDDSRRMGEGPDTGEDR